MTTAITFVIPVRHPQNCSDWGALKARLQETIRSIAAQTSPDWRCVIVANEGSDLPPLPANFTVCHVNFPPNPHYDIDVSGRERAYDSFRLDKGRRVLAGMLQERETKYFMIVDDDDFVSSRITQFVTSHDGANGWDTQEGWLWSEGGKAILPYGNFSKYCGTSLIIRSDLYDLPPSLDEAEEEYMKSWLGSHTRITGILAERGTPLAPLPFRGAVYRIGHAGAHSRSKGIIRNHILNPRLLARPGKLLRNITGLRFIKPEFEREYFGL